MNQGSLKKWFTLGLGGKYKNEPRVSCSPRNSGNAQKQTNKQTPHHNDGDI